MDDLQKWLKFYETGRTPCHKLIFQFGANPEVEDVLVAQGNNQGLMMFDDDKDAPSYRKKAKNLRTLSPPISLSIVTLWKTLKGSKWI